MKKLLVLPGFLLLLSSALGHELTTPVIATAPYQPSAPLTASNGTAFLTTWLMNGGLWVSINDGQSDPAPAVRLLDSPAPPASVVATNDGFVIAIAVDSFGVRLVRVSAAGAVTADVRLDGAPVYGPRLAWNGSNLLLAGIDTFGPYEQSKTRLFLLTPALAVARKIAEVDGYALDVTANGNEFVLASGSGTGVRVYRISAAGELRTGFVHVETPADRASWPAELSVAARPESIVVAWRRYNQANPPGSQVAVIVGETVTRTETHAARPLVVLATPGGYVLAGQGNGVVGVMRLDAHGAQRGSITVPGITMASCAAAGDLVQITHLQSGTWSSKVAATWLRDVTPVKTAVLSTLPIRQNRPSVASDGVEFLATFSTRTADENFAMAARFARSGNGLDGAGIQLGGPLAFPDVSAAFGGGKYFAVWTDGLARGAVIDSAGAIERIVDIRLGASNPRAVWNGSSFFVVWMEKNRIWGSTVSASGELGTARQLSPTPQNVTYQVDVFPDVAWNGREYLVAWPVATPGNLVCTCTPPPPAIARAIRVAADGRPRDTKAMEIAPYGIAGYVDAVHVASNGRDFLLFIDHFDHVDASVIDDSGFEAPHAVFEWLRNANGIGDSARTVSAALTFDGTSYVAAWRYRTATKSWLAVSRIGEPARLTEVGLPDTFDHESLMPAVAVNGVGDVAVVVSEGGRLHARFRSEMQPAPPVPATPRIVAAVIDRGSTTITWDAVESADGYVVEGVGSALLVTLGAEARSLTLAYETRVPVHVRAFNASGVSAWSTTTIAAEFPRRRSTRR